MNGINVAFERLEGFPFVFACACDSDTEGNTAAPCTEAGSGLTKHVFNVNAYRIPHSRYVEHIICQLNKYAMCIYNNLQMFPMYMCP